MLSGNNQSNTLNREESVTSRFSIDPIKYFKEFANSFVSTFEDELSKSKEVLKGHPINVELNTVTKICSVAVSTIPKAGKSASNAVNQVAKWKNQSDEKKKADKLINIITSFTARRIECRIILIRAAMEIFYVQYQQFSIITTKKSQLRAMQKIGFDAAFRLISYLQNNTDIDTLTIDIVTKGVIKGESPIHKGKVSGRGRQLIVNKNKISTSDFFENIAFCVEVHGVPTCFNNRKNIRELGHRTLFSWEDISNFTVNYDLKQTLCVYTRNINTEEFDGYIEQARAYIISQNPYDGMHEDIRSIDSTLRKLVSTNQADKKEGKLAKLDVNNNHSSANKDLRATFKHSKQYKSSTTLLPINRQNFFIINTIVFILVIYFYYNELFKVD